MVGLTDSRGMGGVGVLLYLGFRGRYICTFFYY